MNTTLQNQFSPGVEFNLTPGPSNGMNPQDLSYGSEPQDFGTPVDLSSTPGVSHQPSHDDFPGPAESVSTNDSIRDLIMSAIGVMKTRKARPDTKRISSWIHRRYGRSVIAVTEELERLVTVGELARVDYKGSASFRITNSGSKMRRKRKCNKPLGRSPANNPVPLGGILPPMFGGSPDGSGPQLTLHQLVLELVGEPMEQAHGMIIPTKLIAKAVESTNREFSRAAVLGNLDLILEREVSVGLFMKIDDDHFRLILPNKSFSPSSQSQIQSPMQMASNAHDMMRPPNGMQIFPHNPIPPHQMPPPGQFMLPSDMPRPPFCQTPSDLSFQQGPPFSTSGLMPIPQPPPSPSAMSPNFQQGCTYTMPGHQGGPPSQYQGPPPGLQNFPPLPPFVTQLSNESSDKSDEQIKNDLIRCQLSKMATKEPKAKSPNKRFSEETFRQRGDLQSPGGGLTKKSRANSTKEMLPGAQNLSDLKSFRKKKSVPTPSAADEAATNEETTLNARKKKSKKSLELSDAETSFGQNRSPSPSTNNSNQDSSSYWSHNGDSNEYLKPPNFDVCVHCHEGMPKFINRATEALLRCKDCPMRAHPGCMKYSESLAQRTLSYPWQCMNCKTCSVCHKSKNEGFFLCCDACDQGFHLVCHNPPLSFKPSGMWECFRCQPVTAYVNNQIETKIITNGHPQPPSFINLPQSELPRCPPIAAPFPPPHTGILPQVWNSFEADLQTPDISHWLPFQVSKYFADRGFAKEVCKTFIDQELDGRSLLLMQRNDIVSGLGFKLGPALKLYSHVKKLQLRQICNKTL